MVNYRPNLVPGGTFFFTVALRNRRSHWLTEHITELRGALRNTRNTQPFWIDAMVVLPEHLHTIWTLPPGDIDYPRRWKAIKSRFTRALEASGQKLGKRKDGSVVVWQRRYWEHSVRNDEDLNRPIDSIHFNPVKHEGGACLGVAIFVLSSLPPARCVACDLGRGGIAR